MQSKSNDELRCPRCDHVVGKVETARADAESQDEFRSSGTCQECGLGFRWQELLDGNIYAPRQLFEHAAGFFGSLVPLIRTVVASAIPWYLWARLKLTHEIRPVRCVVLVLAGLAGIHVLAAGVSALTLFQMSLSIHDTTVPAVMNTSPSVQTTFRIGVSVVDAAKASALEFVWPWDPDGRAVPVTYTPLSSQDVVTKEVKPLPPIRQVPMGFDMPLREVYRKFDELLLTAAGYWVAASVCSVAAFVVLPVSRSKAKVRWRHLGRCLAYLLAATPTALLLFGLLGVRTDMAGGVIAMPIFFVAWWQATASRYLRMSASLAIALSVGLIGLLAPISIMVLLNLRFR